jgi:hypothetical protein
MGLLKSALHTSHTHLLARTDHQPIFEPLQYPRSRVLLLTRAPLVAHGEAIEVRPLEHDRNQGGQRHVIGLKGEEAENEKPVELA